MSIYSSFKMSAQAENDGQWFVVGTLDDGRKQRVKLARMGKGNKAYTEAVTRFFNEYGTQYEAGTLPKALEDETTLKIFCDTVLKDWEYIDGKDGEFVDFSDREAYLSEVTGFYELLQQLAQKSEHFREKQNDVDAGN